MTTFTSSSTLNISKENVLLNKKLHFIWIMLGFLWNLFTTSKNLSEVLYVSHEDHPRTFEFCMVWIYRSSHWRCSVIKGVLRNVANFTGNTCARVSLLKSRLWHRCVPVDFTKFLRTLFLQNNPWRLLLNLVN